MGPAFEKYVTNLKTTDKERIKHIVRLGIVRDIKQIQERNDARNWAMKRARTDFSESRNMSVDKSSRYNASQSPTKYPSSPQKSVSPMKAGHSPTKRNLNDSIGARGLGMKSDIDKSEIRSAFGASPTKMTTFKGADGAPTAQNLKNLPRSATFKEQGADGRSQGGKTNRSEWDDKDITEVDAAILECQNLIEAQQREMTKCKKASGKQSVAKTREMMKNIK